MCGICGMLGGAARGAMSGLLDDGADRIARDRALRARVFLANRILQYYRLSLHLTGGRTLVLRTATGKSELVSDVAHVWAAASRLRGKACDPLDPELLSALSSRPAGARP